MSDSGHRQSWNSFWAGKRARGTSGCMPNAGSTVGLRQEQVWQDFARGLPRRAHVLDLATGDGIVLIHMQRARRDLKLLGVDLASTLPTAPSGIRLRGNISIERLPFPDGAFQAVTSQFGFEYADPDGSAAELARVLATGGRAQLLIHNAHGPVVAHNIGRAAALIWARDTVLSKARAFASLPGSASLPIPPFFHDTARDAARLFPGQSAAQEVSLATVQLLESARATRSAGAAVALAGLETRLLGEVERIAALREAACGEERIADMVGRLRRHHLDVDDPTALKDGPLSATAFAWLVAIHKA